MNRLLSRCCSSSSSGGVFSFPLFFFFVVFLLISSESSHSLLASSSSSQPKAEQPQQRKHLGRFFREKVAVNNLIEGFLTSPFSVSVSPITTKNKNELMHRERGQKQQQFLESKFRKPLSVSYYLHHKHTWNGTFKRPGALTNPWIGTGFKSSNAKRKGGLICMADSSENGVESSSSSSLSGSMLDELQQHSKVILDTAHYKFIGEAKDTNKPLVSYVEEVTTNPTILWRSAQLEVYDSVVEGVVKEYKKQYAELSPVILEHIVDDIAVEFALQLTKAIVSSAGSAVSVQPQVYLQVDVRLRNDPDAIRKKAKELVQKYKSKLNDYNLPMDSSLCIKIPGTYAAFKACKTLENEDNVRVLITAVTSALHGYLSSLQKASYIAPYVGRVSDWHKKNKSQGETTKDDIDQGIKLVKEILYHYRQVDSTTQIMGASFRSVEQITALAGVHVLTISPDLLEELVNTKAKGKFSDTLEGFEGNDGQPFHQFPESEEEFRTELCKDDCGYEVFEKSMDLFEQDIISLEEKVMDFFQRPK